MSRWQPQRVRKQSSQALKPGGSRLSRSVYGSRAPIRKQRGRALCIADRLISIRLVRVTHMAKMNIGGCRS